ncbi:hypothetical protein HK098_005873 [Nowakowskiella sp. JEL0407]|nr:hypothetical protein HK098_005873 [Nowakowskiella sp. JEL0407]
MLPSLPFELRQQVTRHLSQSDLYTAIQTCRLWCDCLIRPLWALPVFFSYESLLLFLKTLCLPPEDSFYLYGKIIRELNLSYIPRTSRIYDITDDLLNNLISYCPRLRSLKLPWCKSMTDKFITTFTLHSGNLLLEIDLSCFSESVSRDALVSLVNANPMLEHLDLFGLKIVDDVFVEKLCSCGGVNINYLDLSTSGIGGESLFSISKYCANLRMLFINGTRVTNQSIDAVVKNCKNLQKLGLRRCVNLSDDAVISVAENCDELHTLDLSESTRFTFKAVVKLGVGCTKLKVLDLSYCVPLLYRGNELLMYLSGVSILNRQEEFGSSTQLRAAGQVQSQTNESTQAGVSDSTSAYTSSVSYTRSWKSLLSGCVNDEFSVVDQQEFEIKPLRDPGLADLPESVSAPSTTEKLPPSTITSSSTSERSISPIYSDTYNIETPVKSISKIPSPSSSLYLSSLSSTARTSSRIRSLSRQQLQQEFDGEMIMRTISPSATAQNSSSAKKRDRFLRETEMEELASIASTRTNSPTSSRVGVLTECGDITPKRKEVVLPVLGAMKKRVRDGDGENVLMTGFPAKNLFGEELNRERDCELLLKILLGAELKSKPPALSIPLLIDDSNRSRISRDLSSSPEIPNSPTRSISSRKNPNTPTTISSPNPMQINKKMKTPPKINETNCESGSTTLSNQLALHTTSFGEQAAPAHNTRLKCAIRLQGAIASEKEPTNLIQAHKESDEASEKPGKETKTSKPQLQPPAGRSHGPGSRSSRNSGGKEQAVPYLSENSSSPTQSPPLPPPRPLETGVGSSNNVVPTITSMTNANVTTPKSNRVQQSRYLLRGDRNAGISKSNHSHPNQTNSASEQEVSVMENLETSSVFLQPRTTETLKGSAQKGNNSKKFEMEVEHIPSDTMDPQTAEGVPDTSDSAYFLDSSPTNKHSRIRLAHLESNNASTSTSTSSLPLVKLNQQRYKKKAVDTPNKSAVISATQTSASVRKLRAQKSNIRTKMVN